MLGRPGRRHRRRARPAPRRGDRIGDTAFCVEGGGLVHVVTGSNGENMIRADVLRGVRRHTLDRASAVGSCRVAAAV